MKERILEFPLLDEVIAGGIIKYTTWIEMNK